MSFLEPIRPIDLMITNILWIVSMILLIGVCSAFFFYKSKKSDIKVQSQILFGYGLFCVCYGFTRIFFFIESMFPRDSYPSNLFTLCGYTIGYVSAIFLFFVLERHLIGTKYIFTILSIIAFSLSLAFVILTALFPTVFPIDIPRYFSYFAQISLILSIVILYLWIGKKSSDEVRIRAIGAAISILIIFLGMLFDASIIKDHYIIPMVIAPILVIAGVIMFVFFQRHAGE